MLSSTGSRRLKLKLHVVTGLRWASPVTSWLNFSSKVGKNKPAKSHGLSKGGADSQAKSGRRIRLTLQRRSGCLSLFLLVTRPQVALCILDLKSGFLFDGRSQCVCVQGQSKEKTNKLNDRIQDWIGWILERNVLIKTFDTIVYFNRARQYQCKWGGQWWCSSWGGLYWAGQGPHNSACSCFLSLGKTQQTQKHNRKKYMAADAKLRSHPAVWSFWIFLVGKINK